VIHQQEHLLFAKAALAQFQGYTVHVIFTASRLVLHDTTALFLCEAISPLATINLDTCIGIPEKSMNLAFPQGLKFGVNHVIDIHQDLLWWKLLQFQWLTT